MNHLSELKTNSEKMLQAGNGKTILIRLILYVNYMTRV